MNKAGFHRSADEAIAQGQAARKEVATVHAQAFLQDSAKFDPQCLQSLDAPTLRMFLNTLEEKPSLDQFTSEESKKTADAKTYPPLPFTGWSGQRRAEPNWTLRALTYGGFVGSVFLAVGSVFLLLYGY